ncbi:MAG TPA: DUF3175 domain-containing protein [Candidatus Krumholzibacteria bacterium]|nr:DUF3175 domain-containing protein [Candidatus Krumholzibacteria bacterium]
MKKKTTRKANRNRTTTKKKVRTRVTTRRGTIDIENGLGRMKTARAIARSLKKAADASENLGTAPYLAAMAALDHLIAFLDRQKARLEAAKIELARLYGEAIDEEPNRRHSAGAVSEYRRTAAKSKNGRRSRKRDDMVTSSNLARSGLIFSPA